MLHKRFSRLIIPAIAASLMSACGGNSAAPVSTVASLPAVPAGSQSQSYTRATSRPPLAQNSSGTGIAKGAWMFVVSDTNLRPALDQNVSALSRVAVDIYDTDATIASATSRNNTFVMRTSLADLRAMSTGNNGNPGMLLYDLEHWALTPLWEQNNPVQAIAQAAAIAHGAGLRFGVTPDMKFTGWSYLGAKHGCAFTLSNGVVPGVNWAQVDALTLELQRPANFACSPNGNFSQMVSVVTQVANIVRQQNPNIYINAEFSLGEEPPSTIIAAANSIKSIVNGIYVAYTYTGYSTPANVSATLAGL